MYNREQIIQFYTAEIRFKVEDISISFDVYHNLPNTKGLSIDDAVENWVNRTKKYTAKSLCKYINDKSLCNYINDKNTEFKCFTESEFKKLIEKAIE